MKRIIDICKLIRLPNLLVAIFIMFATRELIIKSILGLVNHSLQISYFQFSLIVLSTVLLIAAGYIINDYFDTKYDRISRLKENIVGIKMERRSAIKLHTTLNLIAVVCAGYVSYSVGYLKLTIIFILASGLLWFYSTSYKRHAVLGKIVISSMIAAMPMIVILFEIPLLSVKYATFIQETGISFLYLLDWTGGFAILLFFSSLIMNLTKDSIKRIFIKEEKMQLSVKVIISLAYFFLIIFTNYLVIQIFNLASFVKYILIATVLLPSLYSVVRLLINSDIKVLKLNLTLSKIAIIGILIICLFIPYLFKNNLI